MHQLTLRMKWIMWIAAMCPAFLSAQSSSTEEPSHPVNWITIEEALERCKTAPRKIMIDVYTSWCGPCKMLSKNTFADDEVSAFLNERFYCVKFNAESADTVRFDGKVFTNPGYDPAATGRNSVHEFTRFVGVSAYPTILFLDEQGKFLLPVSGYRTPPQIEIYLKLVADEHYKSITTTEEWQAWSAQFTPAWQ
ncbi:MAG: thioredoxin family protein [Flavobacteriales bacterium]|jgi:thioredoxin-related protein